MAPLKNPLFSLTASGRLTRAFTLARRLTGPGWLLRGRPADPKTEPQLSWRTMWQLAAGLWHQLSPDERAQWESAGTARAMTGFAWYMSQALRPNPGIYLPLAGGTMTGDIDTDNHTVTGLPAPIQDHHAARKGYVDARIHEHPLAYWRRVNRWHFPFWQSSFTTVPISADFLSAVPFYSPVPLSIDRIGIRVTVGAAGFARLGVYSDDGTIHPGALFSDCGLIDVTVAGNKEIAALGLTFAANTLYWLAYLANINPTVRVLGDTTMFGLTGSPTPDCGSMAGGYQVSQAYGALPDPFPTPATAAPGNRPALGLFIT